MDVEMMVLGVLSFLTGWVLEPAIPSAVWKALGLR